MPTPIANARLEEVRVQFEARFTQGQSLAAPWHQQLAMEIPSGAASNLYSILEDTIEIREWLGEREAQAAKERSYELANRRFEMSRKVNRDRIADDNLGLVPASMEDMGRAAAAFPDRELVKVLTENAYTAFDGLPFFDPSHVKANGDTYSNSSALALTAANFETVLAALMSQTNSAGHVIDVGQRFILAVSPSLRSTAFSICQADFALDASAAGAAVNNPNKGICTPLVIPQLATNPNRWAVFAVGMSVKPLIRQVREAWAFHALDRIDHECVNKRNENEYMATGREAYGVTFPWLAHASDPDGAMT